ncbi:hypothetical protein V7S43_011500 [Phytophthora oleae]|uniref:Secreted protein n=1 Tax=Phytophthora oleae TaxID=2107226 RepID=A0ABD3FBE7_9STRA
MKVTVNITVLSCAPVVVLRRVAVMVMTLVRTAVAEVGTLVMPALMPAIRKLVDVVVVAVTINHSASS